MRFGELLRKRLRQNPLRSLILVSITLLCVPCILIFANVNEMDTKTVNMPLAVHSYSNK
jgi:hypothetical protein